MRGAPRDVVKPPGATRSLDRHGVQADCARPWRRRVWCGWKVYPGSTRRQHLLAIDRVHDIPRISAQQAVRCRAARVLLNESIEDVEFGRGRATSGSRSKRRLEAIPAQLNMTQARRTTRLAQRVVRLLFQARVSSRIWRSGVDQPVAASRIAPIGLIPMRSLPPARFITMIMPTTWPVC